MKKFSAFAKNYQPNVKCFYHRDPDGITAGAIVKSKHPDAELISINYGEAFPHDDIKPTDIVYMVDYSLQPFSEMTTLHKKLKDNFIWIDHHKTAIDEMEKTGLVFKGIQQDGKAGCELTWNYLYPKEDTPEIIELIGAYDTWRNKDKDKWENKILPVFYAVYSLDTPENPKWNDIISGKIKADELINIGKEIYNYVITHNKSLAQTAREISFEGKTFIAINSPRTSSLAFASVYDEKKHDGMLSYYFDKSKVWKISLYGTKPDIDLSIIAKKYGGGGHKQACGFSVKGILPFSIG